MERIQGRAGSGRSGTGRLTVASFSVIGCLGFLLRERGELSAFGRKHLANLNAALKDALPLIERFRQSAMPESDGALSVHEALKQAEAITRFEDPYSRDARDRG